MQPNKVSIYCPYCKRYTSLTVAVTTWTIGSQPIPIECKWEDKYGDLWWIGTCNHCGQPVLICNEGERIYPHPLPSPTDPRIPPKIGKDLHEAKICFSVNAYRACAVMARPAIQSACIDKGTSKNRLVEQLQELADSGVITKDLKEWADLVRWVGNDAAHPDNEEVDRGDAEDILRLAEQFIDVIYVTPAIAKDRREKREK